MLFFVYACALFDLYNTNRQRSPLVQAPFSIKHQSWVEFLKHISQYIAFFIRGTRLSVEPCCYLLRKHYRPARYWDTSALFPLPFVVFFYRLHIWAILIILSLHVLGYSRYGINRVLSDGGDSTGGPASLLWGNRCWPGDGDRHPCREYVDVYMLATYTNDVCFTFL